MIHRVKTLFLKNENLFQTVFKNTVWIGAGQIIGRLLRAALIIYAARALGAAGYGAFSYALSLAGFFSIFSDIGITPLLTREGAKRPELVREYVATGFVIKIVLIAVNTIIIMAALPQLSNIPESIALFPLIALVFIFDSIRDFSFAITRAMERMEIEAGITIITNVAILVCGAATLFFFPQAYFLMAAYALGSGVGTGAMFIKIKGYLGSLRNHFNKKLIKPIITEAWPFGIAGLLSAVMLTTDTIVLGWLRSAEEVGFYGAVQRIILLLYLLPGFLGVSTFPSFSRFAESERERFKHIASNVLRAAMLLALPITIGGILVASPLIILLFGNEYAPAVSTFQILLCTVIITFPGVIVSNALFAFQKQRYLVKTFLVGAISNVALNFLLIPYLGIVGAAVATVVTQLVTVIANARAMRGVVNVPFLSRFSPPVAGNAMLTIATLALSALRVHVLVVVIVAAIVYAGTLFALREPLLFTSLRRLREHFSPQQSPAGEKDHEASIL